MKAPMSESKIALKLEYFFRITAVSCSWETDAAAASATASPSAIEVSPA